MMARFGVPDAIPVALRRAMRKAKSSVRRRAGFLWNSRTWKLLLVPTVLMMAADLVLFSGHGADAVTVAKNLSKANLVVALTDPMSLLDARSPGGRGVGPLQQSKPGGPHERVLSEVRDRDPAPSGGPVAGGSPNATGDDDTAPNFRAPSNPFPDTGIAPAGGGSGPGGGFGFPPVNPFAPGFGPASSGGIPTPADIVSNDPPPVDTSTAGDPPPGGGTTPPDDGPTPPGGTPTGGTPTDGGDPPVAVPEPASWALMVGGLLAASLFLRRRRASMMR